MPTYEYKCNSCAHSFEVFQSMSDPPLKDCPQCGSEVRRLIFGGTGVIFKGSGFYVTDKSRDKAAKPVSKKPGSLAGDSGSKTGSTVSEPAGTPEKVKPETKSA